MHRRLAPPIWSSSISGPSQRNMKSLPHIMSNARLSSPIPIRRMKMVWLVRRLFFIGINAEPSQPCPKTLETSSAREITVLLSVTRDMYLNALTVFDAKKSAKSTSSLGSCRSVSPVPTSPRIKSRTQLPINLTLERIYLVRHSSVQRATTRSSWTRSQLANGFMLSATAGSSEARRTVPGPGMGLILNSVFTTVYEKIKLKVDLFSVLESNL